MLPSFLVMCDNMGFNSKWLQRRDGKESCYIMDTFSVSKNYYATKLYCRDKGGILPAIKDRQDQTNVKEMLRRFGNKV